VVSTYSSDSARPVTNPPHGPIDARANEYAPPVCGIAALISPIENSMPKYMTTTTTVAMRRPPHPALVMPAFQPEKSPEMTAATPMPQIPQNPADRLRVRCSKYAAPACS
jgi:hypothetical protein